MYARRIAALLLTAVSLVIVPSPAVAAGAGGGRTGDFTRDDYPDILARVAADGRLVVYPRDPSDSGTGSFDAPVTINSGWGGMRWIGVGDVGGYKEPYYDFPDVLSVDNGGVMRVAAHRGRLDGTRTLNPQVVVGSGWQINDLIHSTSYYEGQGDGLVARRKGTGDVYLYKNTGRLDTGMFEPPSLLFTGRQNDVWQAVEHFTDDFVPDLLFVDTAGRLGVFDPVGHTTTWLGTGWQTVDSMALVTGPGFGWLYARRRSDGMLLSYRRTTTLWQPAPNGTAYHLYAPPEVLGFNWQVNDIIT